MDKNKFTHKAVTGITLGFILSIIFHFFVLFPVLRQIHINTKEKIKIPYNDDDTIFLEDIVIPKKDEDKKTDKLIKSKPKPKNKITKETEKQTPKKIPEQHIVEDYRKVPKINPNQKFTIKKNKKPKGSPKIDSEIANSNSLPNIAEKIEKEPLLQEQNYEDPILSSPPTLEDINNIDMPPAGDNKFKEENKTFVLKEKKEERNSPWNLFRMENSTDSLQEFAMLEPDNPIKPVLKKKTKIQGKSKGLLEGKPFDLNDFRNKIGSFLSNKNKQKGYSFGSLTFGDEEFQNEWYARIIVSKVAHKWYPPGIAHLGASGITTVFFSITRSGKIKNHRINKRSNYPSIDESASNAVALSSPFPPLPEDYLKNKLDINFTFYVNVHIPPEKRKN